MCYFISQLTIHDSSSCFVVSPTLTLVFLKFPHLSGHALMMLLCGFNLNFTNTILTKSVLEVCFSFPCGTAEKIL